MKTQLDYLDIHHDSLILANKPSSTISDLTETFTTGLTTGDQVYNDIKAALPKLQSYNDPSSHGYVPRINEAALDDIQQRLDFQNRVYAYTSIGLITVIVAGILINSNRQ